MAALCLSGIRKRRARQVFLIGFSSAAGFYIRTLLAYFVSCALGVHAVPARRILRSMANDVCASHSQSHERVQFFFRNGIYHHHAH